MTMNRSITKYYQVVVCSIMLAATPMQAAPRIAVFCSASKNVCERFQQETLKLGQKIAEHRYGLVTGGTSTGLMNTVVRGYIDTAESLQELYGVVPEILRSFDDYHPGILPDNLIWVDSFGERLQQFHDLSDIVVVLPGGFGTLHELMDFLVYNKFSNDKHPIVLLNIDHHWDHLLAQFDHMVEQKVLSQKCLDMVQVVESAAKCVELLDGISNN